ncbi:MAG: GNAT family N-acetyltransferase [Planctomycetota bacterium]|jgi:putative acetyltransferase
MTKREGEISLRPLEAGDEGVLLPILHGVMVEYGLTEAGSWEEESGVVAVKERLGRDGCVYLVALLDGEVVGGGGIAPLEDGPEGVCELYKMYLSPSARGKGIGRRLLGECLDAAKKMGYARCYLETSQKMTVAQGMYEREGFEKLEDPLRRSGFRACDRWYSRKL